MPAEDGDRKNLYDNLRKQGVSEEQIAQVYRDLRGKGYGKEEARRRSQAALKQAKSQAAPQERRGSETSAAPRKSGNEPNFAVQKTVKAKPGLEVGKRAIDWLPPVSPELRRKINRYAFRNGFLITRLHERFDDFVSIFDPTREDRVSFAFMRLLAERKGYRADNPFALSFIDDLDALRDSARVLLGREPRGQESSEEPEGDAASDEVVRALRTREPFALEFLSQFTQRWQMLRLSLRFLEAKLSAGIRALVPEVARVAKDGCRLIASTEAVEQEELDSLLGVVRDTNLSLHPGEKSVKDLTEAEEQFRAAYQNLRTYGHELYPALLKMIASFYDEQDRDPQKRAQILRFLELPEDQILTWEGSQRRRDEEREKALAEQRAKELETLDREKAEKFPTQFAGTLANLAALFPDSGIEKAEQGAYTVPYFVSKVFTHTTLFQTRLADMERLSALDVMGLVMVFHTILDDLLSCVDPYALERIVGRQTLAGDLIALRALWSDAYERLFSPYLDEIREFAREIEGDPEVVKMFRESQRARGIEERVNRLRNRAIRNFGHVIVEDHYEGPRLYELAARLAELLADAGELINADVLAATDPVRRKVAAELASRRIVDYVSRSQASSPEFRPVIRQMRRWIEDRFHESVLDIPQKSQIVFVDFFLGITELYNYLLNDPTSFASDAGHDVVVASTTEADVWLKQTGVPAGGALDTLLTALEEEFPGQYEDSLTGLRNSDYLRSELQKELSNITAHGKPLTFLMIDVDHLTWVNDELGRPQGDDVLKLAAQLIRDTIGEGDIGVRYGGEELLVVIPSDLHAGIVLAERLRCSQEQGVWTRVEMRDVRQLGDRRAAPCGTLSIGVADATGFADLGEAVQRSERALIFAKSTRNAVVFLDPSKGQFLGDPFTSYAEYRQKSGRAFG